MSKNRDYYFSHIADFLFVNELLEITISKNMLSQKLLRINCKHFFKLDIMKSSTASFDVEKPYKLFLLDIGPETKFQVSKESALTYYENMFTIRRFEQKAADLYKSREIKGFCHLAAGQEACGVGMKAAMRDKDTIITSYRCHGWTFLQGVPIDIIFAELIGRVTGCSRGKGGSMHMFGRNFLGGTGIVGAQVPLGTGSAFAHKYQGTGGVCFILYGDGAANQGQIQESYNMAKLFNLPAIFVCENNKFGMGTADFRAAASVDFYKRACYIPGIWVDGMDILAVREATRFALAHILAENGPIVMELETYRYFGHSMSDPGTSYRTREDVQKVRETQDPIMKFKNKILQAEFASEKELKEIEKEISKKVEAAANKALKDPFPGMDEMCSDIYKEPQRLLQTVRGISPFTSHKHSNIGKPLFQ